MFYDFHTHRVPAAGVAALVSAPERPEGLPPECRWSCQLHPWHGAAPAKWAERAGTADAVGEAGLDRRRGAEWAQQLEWWHLAVATAARYGKPLVLHEVHAFAECAAGLRKHPELPVLRHGWNTPDAVRLEEALGLGWRIGVGWKTPPETVEFFRCRPEFRDRLALESDDTAEPEALTELYLRVAAQLAIPMEILLQEQERNFYNFLKGHP